MKNRILIVVFCTILMLVSGTGIKPAEAIQPLAPTITNHVIYPDDLQGWIIYNGSLTGGVHFMPGPGTPPLGTGSSQFQINNASEAALLYLYTFAGTKLSGLTSLTYSTYHDPTSLGDPNLQPIMLIAIDYDVLDTDNSWQGHIYYEPSLTPGNTPVKGSWQTWNTLVGLWWADDLPGSTICPQSTPCSLATLITAYPNIGVSISSPAIGFQVGWGWADGFIGNVDKLSIGDSTTNDIYDFEPLVTLALTDLDLLQSVDQSTWRDVSGNLATGFTMVLNPIVPYYYLDTANLITNRTLKDGYYPFTISSSPDGFLDYWNPLGVNAEATPGTWQAQMWQIINGNAPFFYVKVSGSGTTFDLIDGLDFVLFPGEDHKLKVNGTYLLGNYSFTGAVSDNFGYTDPVSVAILFTPPHPLTVTGITALNKPYDRLTSATINTSGAALIGVIGVDSVTLNVSGAHGVFSDKNAGVGKTVTISGLVIEGEDAIDYSLTQPSASANIIPKSITGSFTANNKVYDRLTTATVANRSVSGVISPDVVTLTGGTAAFDTKNVGVNKTVTLTGASLAGADATNYSLLSVAATLADITPKSLTGSFTADNKVYDRLTAATVASRSVSGVISPDAVTLTGGTATFDTKNVGVNKTVTLTGASLAGTDATNYSLLSVATTLADITPKSLTGSFTANDKVYDQLTTAAVASRSVSGVISPDVVTLTGGTAAFDTKNVGVNKTVTLTGASLSGTDTANYALSSVATALADITPKTLTGSFNANDKVYDQLTTAAVASRSLSGVISPDAVTLTGGTATFDTKNVGVNKTVTLTGASLAGADATNYTLLSVATDQANITPKSVTGSFTADNKVYDRLTTAAVASRSVSGVISPDAVTLTGGTATFDTKNVGVNKTVTLTGASLAGTDATNYSLLSVATTLADITPKSLTGSFNANDKVYDQLTTAAVASRSVSGVISPDVVTLTGGTAAFDTKNVGVNKTVTLTGASLAGADATNYSLLSVATALADITPKSLTGSFTANNKGYDGTTTATVASRSVSGVIAPDVANLTGGTATFDNKNVGLNKVVTLTGASLTGADAANYSLLSVATAQADIAARDLSVASAGVNKVYDGTSTASVTFTDNRLTGDVITILYTANFDNANVGTDKPVSVTGISLGGPDGGNYNLLNTTASTTASITPKPISVTAKSNQLKAFKTSDPVFAFTYTPNDPPVSFTGALSRESGEEIGTYAITLGTLSAGPNYTLNFTSAQFQIVGFIRFLPIIGK